jgi:hypothetical protein
MVVFGGKDGCTIIAGGNPELARGNAAFDMKVRACSPADVIKVSTGRLEVDWPACGMTATSTEDWWYGPSSVSCRDLLRLGEGVWGSTSCSDVSLGPSNVNGTLLYNVVIVSYITVRQLA